METGARGHAASRHRKHHGAPSPLDRLANWRNKLLQNRQFLHWAQRLPLLRQVARHRARDLFGLVSGFVNSQVLLACVDLNLLGLLAESARSRETIGRACGLEKEPTRVLLQAAESLGLIERQSGDHYGLAPLGVSLLSDPGLLALVRHHRALYRDLEDPVSLLRGDNTSTALSAVWPYAKAESPQTLDRQAVSGYTDVMAASQHMITEQILHAFPFGSARNLLDIGGGDGSFVAALALRFPQLQLSLFDLPSVAEIARQRLDAAGLSERVQVFSGDFHQGDLPPGQDLVSLVRILHDHDDEPALKLLQAARQAMNPGGTLMIAEPLRATPGAEEMGAAYFGFYLLAMGSGRPRSFMELKELLLRAGFQQIHQLKTPIPLICSVVTAS